jgi:hypothetical protein
VPDGLDFNDEPRKPQNKLIKRQGPSQHKQQQKFVVVKRDKIERTNEGKV